MGINLGERLQLLRKSLGYTQKEFSEFVNIPQPSLSAYENDKNSPTTEVLINIAEKCKVSLDWLCGLTEKINREYKISDLSDIVDIMYKLMELNDIKIEVKVNDNLLNDNETETNRWYTQLTIYGNDKVHMLNADLCKIIASVDDNLNDLETYAIDKDTYEIKKERTIKYYNYPLTKKNFPELNREERLKKHIEYLNTIAPK